jgi:hypothetical protein
MEKFQAALLRIAQAKEMRDEGLCWPAPISVNFSFV